MTHDPKVQALIDAVDGMLGFTLTDGSTHEALIKARKALNPGPPKPREWWLNEITMQIEPSDKWLGGSNMLKVREVLPNEKPVVWMPEPNELFGDTVLLEINRHGILKQTYRILRNHNRHGDCSLHWPHSCFALQTSPSKKGAVLAVIKFLMCWSAHIQNEGKALPKINIPTDVWTEFIVSIEKEIMPSLSMTIAGDALTSNQVKILGFTFTRAKSISTGDDHDKRNT